MHSNSTIQNELKELNSLLAGISNVNVYSVPDGYFDVLSHDILLSVHDNSPAITAGNTVPAGYFDGLANTIIGKIKAGVGDENAGVLAGIQNSNIYTVPRGYFDGLADTILEKIKAGSAAEEGSAILDGLKGINVYRVPLGYFDNLALEIVSKIPQPARVIEMKKRSSFFNYAAAAVITGIMGLSVISVFDKKQTDGALPSSTGISVAAIEIGDKIVQDKSFDAEFATITDADIVDYLKTDGQDINTLLVASLSEDNNLPEQVDYMTDDNTLDNLLNGLKSGESTNN